MVEMNAAGGSLDGCPRKKLGVIGGLGPAASAHFYRRVTELTDAATDQQHLEVALLSIPQTPDRTAFLSGGSDVSFVPALSAAAHQLESWGCEVLCVTCVTAHSLFDQVFGGLISARALHMPREAARAARGAGCTKVGIMATDGTARTGVLQKAVEAEGLETCLPDPEHQRLVMSLIYDDVKMGAAPDMGKFEAVCRHLRERGCDGVILGCTELSLIDTPASFEGMAVVDAMEALAACAVRACGAKVREDALNRAL